MQILKEIDSVINTLLPPETQVSKIEMEGPEVAIYTKNPKAFFENENYVAKLAYELKKRVNIRTDKSLLKDETEARELISKIVPTEADIRNIWFNPAFSEVVIESIKPGLVIGKGGETSKRIILDTGWTPNIIRAPTSPSEILTGIRHHVSKYSSERKKFLAETAHRIYRDKEQTSDFWIRLTALGGFQEVGRSCILLETPHTKIIMDVGLDVAVSDKPFPYLDSLNFPLSELDAVIISHAHMDHAGFLPYLFKMNYQGPVYCTKPTRDLMTLLQLDYIDIAVKEGKKSLYSEKDVKECLKHVITREYREVTDIAPDVRMTFHNAAHILGSASVHLHIGEGQHNLVYSADIKYGFSRLFNNIDLKYPRLETLIVEATYGSKDDIQPDRMVSEQETVKVINETIRQAGNVLIPVFAVGRSQEIMLVLEEAYRRGELEGAKVYVDGMTKESSAIHTAYPEYLRKGVQNRVLQNDSPFTSELFKVVLPGQRDEILKEGGAIVLASSGMLTGGASLAYFHKMAEDPRNTLIFVGYQGEGSLGRKLQNNVKEIPITGENGRTKNLHINMRIESIEGFSGHSDRSQLVNYLRNLRPKPKRVLVNHGNKHKTIEFSKFVQSKFHINASAPHNLDSIRLT